VTSLWLDGYEQIPTDPLQVGGRYDVAVVGAGLTGLTTALLLARAGKSVVVIEARSVGVVATGNSTAKLSLLHGGALAGIHQHTSSEVLKAKGYDHGIFELGTARRLNHGCGQPGWDRLLDREAAWAGGRASGADLNDAPH